ncbi:uncharacterized protein E0L32_011257 [Thyridium curvatum]|uniref:Uncharacterized protein n=1 Tax=Thyridium curvatum TaxID=1093900 RepID=A0A507BI27_9PEZI|nr:uncharacterized protein E0L32_011257 [Thyridium curvatum]TPX19096.1 hypothetical protein E0L32_011257 [Thyridium curvatum]
MGYRLLHRPWRVKNPIYWLMLAELLGLVPILVLFGIAQPDMYRTTMWRIGNANGWNSNPNMILYAYANHRPLPIRMVSNVSLFFFFRPRPPQPPGHLRLTNFNVAISVISLFMLLVKMIGFIMKVWYPLVGGLISLALTALYVASMVGQMGPDHADRDPSKHSSVAWYISHSCAPARAFNAERSCMLAKGTFAVTVYMAFLYVVNTGLAVWALLPNRGLDVEEDEYGGGGGGGDDDNSSGSPTSAKQWEMQPPRTPHGTTVPFTPRTQAFHALDRKLPLRYG